MTIECTDCTEEIPNYIAGSFTLFLLREGEETYRDIGNVVVGTFQDEIETFIGAPADGSLLDVQNVYQIRHAVNLIVTADEITCENLRLFLQGPAVNIPGGNRILLDHVQRRDIFQAIAERDLCNGTFLQIVLHRVSVVTPTDVLFQQATILGNQFTLRALRDPNNTDHPFGYWEIVPGDCAVS